FSIEAAKGNEEALLSNLRKNMNLTSLILFPTAALLTVLAVPVVSVFFQRGNFTGDDARYMGYALAFYAPWLAQFGIGSLVSRAFYAQKDSATPVIIGIIGIICNVLLNLILIGPLGIGGLALATTVTSTGKTVYLIWSLSRKMGGLNLRLIIGEQFRILLANAFLVVGALLLIRFWPFSTESDIVTRFLQLAAYSSIGVLFMLVFLRVSGSSTFREISSRIAEKVRGRISR
ncbi:MAG TPA: lipid II flippase MurJ, partial [Candidatus Sabulitectum sp.]|nr:lipid II flippase MurJ [Candidatus Sabulitectum sp.]